MLAEEIRRLAEEEQIPVLGFGPASAMANERPGYRPEDFLPAAQSLICFGLPVPQGAYQTPAHTLETVCLSKLRPESAARHMSLRAFDEHTFHICSKCVALCPYGEGQ